MLFMLHLSRNNERLDKIAQLNIAKDMKIASKDRDSKDTSGCASVYT
jgi:hypothetical protein